MKQAGYALGVFGASVALALIWLVISKLMPSLRQRLGISYSIAALLAFVPSFVAPHGLNVLSLIGPVVCVGLLFWQYRRDRERLKRTSKNSKGRRKRKSKAKRV
jgi:hypothetical protein